MAKKKYSTNTGIPGLSFSWKRALGLTRTRQRVARKIGVPTTKAGVQRKIGGYATGSGCLLQLILMLLSAFGLTYFVL